MMGGFDGHHLTSNFLSLDALEARESGPRRPGRVRNLHLARLLLPRPASKDHDRMLITVSCRVDLG